MKQRHQILAHGLRNQSLNDANGLRPIRQRRMEDIGFAHARANSQSDPGGANVETTREMETLVKPPFFPSSSPSSLRQSRIRKSKLLEDLDINERM